MLYGNTYDMPAFVPRHDYVECAQREYSPFPFFCLTRPPQPNARTKQCIRSVAIRNAKCCCMHAYAFTVRYECACACVCATSCVCRRITKFMSAATTHSICGVLVDGGGDNPPWHVHKRITSTRFGNSHMACVYGNITSVIILINFNLLKSSTGIDPKSWHGKVSFE